MRSALVIGASRGIGFGFARQYASDGWRVTGTYRSEADADRLRAIGVEPLALDVLAADAPQQLAAALTTAGGSLDVAIINAGIHGPQHLRIGNPPGVADFDLVMHTNVYAPMRLLGVLAGPVEAARGTIALLSSRMGSVSETDTPNSLLYRTSKAALNMVTKAAHVELSPQGVRVLALHPGWVRTDLGGPGASLEVDESVRGMRQVIAAPQAYPGGGFFDWSGEAVGW